MRKRVPADPVLSYVAVGANLGDAAQAVERAIGELADLPHSRVTARSSLYRSAPVHAAGPDYVNAVVALETRLSPPDLLAGLQRIEQAAGRERLYRNAPRTLDLDILLYADLQIDSAALTIPHPRMNERAFVLVPLAEIAPQRVSAGQLAALGSQVIARITRCVDR